MNKKDNLVTRKCENIVVLLNHKTIRPEEVTVGFKLCQPPAAFSPALQTLGAAPSSSYKVC